MRNQTRDGLLLALGGFALLSTGDTLVKSMAGLWPGPAIAALRYIIGTIGLGTILLWREGWAGFRMERLGWHAVRGFGVAISAISFFTAVQIMPIAEATAISFTSPMMTALLASVLIGEPMRRETWVASLVAFAGVLIVLRPNFAVIGVAAMLPVIAAIGMSLLIIGNRAVLGRGSALSMQVNVAIFATLFLLGFTLIGHVSGFAALHVGTPPWSVVGKSAMIAVTGSTAHALMYMATSRAGAATVAPMTYFQLIMAGFYGWLLFRETPDATALLGAAIIVGAGFYLWRAGRITDEPQGTE
ncbi:DMT family transporter [Novosphingobium sp.]|uniref:DMT family transporter n=1 Tax=Novosphingobium sp. TaxID=1874826 RepID=UPI001DE73013|nr:DMT family transporter [Novosphingobium sp.]MBX9662736.1 DMT family transporter [Novosphingobium sp.]